MKSKLLLLTSLILLTVATSFSQSSASSAGIAVQGIARDNNNTARISASVSLAFEIYYLNNSNNAVPIYSENVTLQTDAFGVFSHVLDPGSANNAIIANNIAYLRITEGASIISDEKLKHVPYAIAASNGVPTGSIMPFVGTVAPPGWVICDGGSLTSVPSSAALIGLLGSNNSPNLQGMFLRGAGVSPVNGQAGPSLNTTQNDAYQDHGHFNNFSINNGGNHSHTTYLKQHATEVAGAGGNNANVRAVSYDGNPPQVNGDIIANPAGNHSHGISGGVSWANYGNRSSETRPVNYGVNYIIKL